MPKPHERPIIHLNYSFLWSFYYIKNSVRYYDGISDIISKGGETSMNAAIVGGLLGAFYGV